MNRILAIIFLALTLSSPHRAQASATDIEQWRLLSDSGLALRNSGKIEAAIAKLQESLKLAKKAELHDSLLTQSLGNIGYSYTMIGSFRLALKYYLQSAPLDSMLFGATSADYAGTLALIGQAYLYINLDDSARPFLSKSVKIFSQAKKKLDYWHVTALAYYGTLLTREGSYREAEKHLRKGLKISLNSRIASGMRGQFYSALYGLHLDRGEWAKAEENLHREMEFYSERESDSAQRLGVRIDFLTLYDKSGQREKYITLYNELYLTNSDEQFMELLRGEDCMFGASAYLDSGMYAAADSAITACLSVVEQEYGAESQKYISYLGYFALEYYKAGQFLQQYSLLKEEIRLSEIVFGKDSPNLITPLIEFGGSEEFETQPDSSLVLLLRAANIIEDKLNGVHPRRDALESAIGSAYLTQKKYGEAYTHYEKALQATKEIYGKESFLVGAALVSLAVSDYLSGFPKRMGKHAKEAVEIFRSYPESPDGGYPVALNWLSLAYEEQGRWRDALEIQFEVIEVLSTWPLFPKMNYAESFSSLARYYNILGIYDSSLLMTDNFLEQTAIESGKESEAFMMALTSKMFYLLGFGDTAQALEVARQRVAISESHHDEYDSERSSALIALSQFLFFNNQFDTMLIIADSAYQVSIRSGGSDTPEASVALRNLIMMQRHNEQYHQAEINAGVFLAPSASLDPVRDDSMSIISQYEVAVTVFASGEYQLAESLMVALLPRQEEIFGKNSPEVFNTLIHLTAAHHHLQNHQELLEVANRAISIAPMNKVGVHRDIGNIYSVMIPIARVRGDYVESQRLISNMREEGLLDSLNHHDLYLNAEEYQASLYFEMNEFARVDSTVRVALSYAKSHVLRSTTDTMLIYARLIRRSTDVLMEVEMYDSARVCYESISQRLNHRDEVDTALTAIILIRLGEALGYLGEFDSSMAVFESVRELIRADLPHGLTNTLADDIPLPISIIRSIDSGTTRTITFTNISKKSGSNRPDTLKYSVVVPEFDDSIERNIYLDSIRKFAELRADVDDVQFPYRTHFLHEYFLALGKVFEFREELDSAGYYLSKSSSPIHNSAIFKTITYPSLKAQVLLADLFLRRNQIVLAHNAYRMALDSVVFADGRWGNLGALAHFGLGKIYETQGRIGDAEREFNAMVTSSEAMGEAVSLEVAESLTKLASFLKRQNKLREASELLNRAERMISDVHGHGDLRRLEPLLELYETYSKSHNRGKLKRVKSEISKIINAQEKRKTLIKRSTVVQMLNTLHKLDLKDEAKRLSILRK